MTMRSNCLFWALAVYWRRTRFISLEGERYFVLWRSGRHLLLTRPSRLGGWIPHVLYAERRRGGLRIVHFVPADKRPKNIPPPLFRGEGRWGDRRK